MKRASSTCSNSASPCGSSSKNAVFTGTNDAVYISRRIMIMFQNLLKLDSGNMMKGFLFKNASLSAFVGSKLIFLVVPKSRIFL